MFRLKFVRLCFILSYFFILLSKLLFFINFLYSAFFSKDGRFHKFAQIPLLLFFFTIFLSAISKAKVKDSNYAIIFSPVAKVMTAPSVNSSTTYQLHEGSKAKITGESDQWYEISFNERKGWIEKKYLKKI